MIQLTSNVQLPAHLNPLGATLKYGRWNTFQSSLPMVEIGNINIRKL